MEHNLRGGSIVIGKTRKELLEEARNSELEMGKDNIPGMEKNHCKLPEIYGNMSVIITQDVQAKISC